MGANTEFSSLDKWIDDGLSIAPLPSRKEARQREGVEFGGTASSLCTGYCAGGESTSCPAIAVCLVSLEKCGAYFTVCLLPASI